MNDHVRARTDSRRPRPARRALLCCAVLLSLAAVAIMALADAAREGGLEF